MKKAARVFLISIIVITGLLKFTSLISPVNRYDNTIIGVEIKSGSSSREISQKLYNKGLIKSARLFNILVSVSGFDNSLKAGYYEWSPSDNLISIIKDLNRGRVATFKITIPEGFTVEEVAEKLGEVTFYSKENYLSLAEGNNFNRPYLPRKRQGVKYVLEGFLYPDTYIIPKEYNPGQVLNVMLNNFEEKCWQELREKSLKKGITPYEAIIIASLIEKEARLETEKPIISAVIYNRLRKGMLLQIDATVQYSLPEWKDRVLYKDLRIDSRYNTYKYPGLPPGPICNPGKSSIEAALNPADVDYLFYFALEDGSHIFTTTYEEHLRQQNKYRRGLENE
ncbi:endolytic transglycosylase MltG [Halothermothrix orenii]|uniref:Endolytic murein transglycosylase n=1 Tax=Halothermothrix orenii (strain H 168 / OCM 544 / DSM 9562) TaxID=373903 RepID=B8D2B2_HALOH|nr:endolytic transglycosylase MltG [Halothermothrix orenii]ACL69339.1 aminodeoxychorismate lyase [Halothermothrix orenii H 168]